MYNRESKFYNVVAKGLAALGFNDDAQSSALTKYLNYFFANKYNAEKTFAQMGFSVNPNIPLSPTFDQLNATVRKYTMAGFVDIDSDGPTKSTDGMSLMTGNLPTFKHEIPLDRRTMRDQRMLMQRLGKADSDIEATIMRLFFNSLDDLLGGNYNTLQYMRHQIVSNKCAFNINAINNPLGYADVIQFDRESAGHDFSDKVYKKDASTGEVTESSKINDINPLKKMRQIRRNAMEKNQMPRNNHWEVDVDTWEDFINLPWVRQQYVAAVQPLVSDADVKASMAGFAQDAAIKTFIEGIIGPVKVIDAYASVEAFDKDNKKMVYKDLKSFEEGVFVLVPDGIIGDVQFGAPDYMVTPGATVGLYDGGRTLIRTIFNDETMTAVTKSEVTGLVVPQMTRWMYYYTVKSDNVQ